MTRLQDEPDREWQTKQHEQRLQGDPTAFARISERALSHLVRFLRSQFPQENPHLHEMVAIDCLLSYNLTPQQYNPEKLSLFAYLRMAARGDMLNAINSQRRREKRLASLDDPAFQDRLWQQDDLGEEFVLDDWLKQHTTLSRQEILERVTEELDEKDRAVLLLMAEGVRDGRRYAEVMGITQLDAPVRRQEIKRAKDRLGKRLRRLGSRLDSE